MGGFKESISGVCPGLELERVELTRAGQNNELILVYGGLIFRFPKFVEDVEGATTGGCDFERVAAAG